MGSAARDGIIFPRAQIYAMRVSKTGATCMAVLKSIQLQFVKADMPFKGVNHAEAPYMGGGRMVIGVFG